MFMLRKEYKLYKCHIMANDQLPSTIRHTLLFLILFKKKEKDCNDYNVQHGTLIAALPPMAQRKLGNMYKNIFPVYHAN